MTAPTVGPSRIRRPPQKILFLHAGGTWAEQESPAGRVGVGGFDDTTILAMQEQVIAATTKEEFDDAYLAFGVNVYHRMTWDFTPAGGFNVIKPQGTVMDLVGDACPAFNLFADGPYMKLFNGDSAHHDAVLSRALICKTLEMAVRDPQRRVILAMGTNTADLVLPELHAHLFDKPQIPGILVVVSNDPLHHPNSDMPQTLTDAARLSQRDIGPGAHLVSAGKLFSGADVTKADPGNQNAGEIFRAPHGTARRVSDVLRTAPYADSSQWFRSGAFEPLGLGFDPQVFWDTAVRMGILNYGVHPERYLKSAQSTVTVDLGSQDDLWTSLEKIRSPETRSVVVAGHGQGSVPYPIRAACIDAVRRGTFVVAVSRSFVGRVGTGDMATLLSANNNKHELQEHPEKIIDGGTLSKVAARAVLVRCAMQERGRDQTSSAAVQGMVSAFADNMQPLPSLTTSL